jgi:hypothetical protein
MMYIGIVTVDPTLIDHVTLRVDATVESPLTISIA